MKLVDVPDSKSGVLRDVWVRLPLSAQNMISKKTYNKIGVIFSISIFIFLVSMQMFSKVKHEMTPEGRFKNYKLFITDSVELWVKNRDNGYYTIENVINFYESPDEKGAKPMDKFPPIIYKEIKKALSATFIDYVTINDLNQLKKIILDEIDINKNNIIKNF